jgi:protein-L-isoaspartate(D-aspartate) O-methyltransferase
MATDLGTKRMAFAEQLRRAVSLRSMALVRAFATVPREHFVGPGPWKTLAPPDPTYHDTPGADPQYIYDDVLVAIDESRVINNGQPSALARWLDFLELNVGDRFLHIGCGVGYYTAIAAQVVSERGTVVGVEIDEGIAELARRNLRGYANATVIGGNGTALGSDAYDAILVNAGATEIRNCWLDQLRLGGRLPVPLTTSIPGMPVGLGHMLLIAREPRGYTAGFVSPVGIFHCVGARTEEGEQLLKQAFARGGQDLVRSLRREDHYPNDQCWFHRPGFCLSRLNLGNG